MTTPVRPISDRWPLPDLEHVPVPPTDFRPMLLLAVLSAVSWFGRASLTFVPAAAFLTLYVLTALFVAAAVVGNVFGRYRPSLNRPVMVKPGKWRCSSWSGTHVFTPDAVYVPMSFEELLSIVEECGQKGHKIKPAGSLHSWSPCAVTDSVSIQMGGLDRVLSVDSKAMTIEAEAGIRLRDLYTRMEQSGLALPCLPNVDTIQLGGAIANATHGTCIQAGSMCSLVAELQLVVFQDGHARRITLRRETEDSHERHLFEAAVASFGALGIIYSVTLRCVQPFHSYVHELVLPFDALKNRFAAIARENYSVRFMWSPVTDIVFTKLQVPISGPLVRANVRSITSRMDLVIVRVVSFANERQPRQWRKIRQLLSRLVNWRFRQTRTWLLRNHNRGWLATWYDGELESRTHAAFVRHPFVNLEYAIPFDRCDQAVNELRALFKRFPVQAMNFVGLRPVGADDAGYLAAPKGQAVVYFDIPYAADLESTGLYAAIERKCLELGGRCSWSRLIYASPQESLKNYPEHFKFVEAKRELDPSNIFSNTFSDRICFPDEAESCTTNTGYFASNRA